MNEAAKLVRRSVIKGSGSALPARIMTNADMSKVVDTSDEWIVERTGIHARHFADEAQSASDLALPACLAALRNAGKAHQIESVGAELRSMMPWISAGKAKVEDISGGD